jgi:putative FmdB family regulatory protein
MPIFEYACGKCGKVFEKLVLGRDPVPAECPHCGSKRVEQIFSSFATVSAGGKSSAAPACGPSGGG